MNNFELIWASVANLGQAQLICDSLTIKNQLHTFTHSGDIGLLEILLGQEHFG